MIKSHKLGGLKVPTQLKKKESSIMGSEGMQTMAILALLAAIAATVLAFVFVVPEKKRENLNGFGRFLHDTVNFKYLVIEKILQAFYIFSTVYIIILGFFGLFQFETRYEFSRYGYEEVQGDWIGYQGLLLMILGPIVIRIAYELIMMALLLVKNVVQINKKMKNANEPSAEGFDAVQPYNAQSNGVACPNCGEYIPADKAGSFCPYCGHNL